MGAGGTSRLDADLPHGSLSRRHKTETRLEDEEEANLSEIAAPPPPESDKDESWRRQSHLDSTSHGSLSRRHKTETRLEDEEEANLTEIAAPPPPESDKDESWRRQSHLDSTGDDHENKPLSFAPEDVSSVLTQFYIVSYLVFFSLWGVLARLGVQWVSFYPGAPVVIANLWANVGGCFCMGFLAEDRNLFRQEWGAQQPQSRMPTADRPDEEALKRHVKVKKTIPLYVGLTVGFCGTFTSFSSFLFDAFNATANDLPAPAFHYNIRPALVTQTVSRHGGYSFEAVLAIVLLTVGMSVSAHACGAHVAHGLDTYTPAISFRATRRFVDPSVAVLAWGCWLGAVLLTIWPPDRPDGPASAGAWPNEHWRGEVLFALVFAPLGCLLRFALSVRLNSLLIAFPLGTFAANVLGTAVLCMCNSLQRVPLAGARIGGGQAACQVLQGLHDGFCGALTTVSTWVAELRGLKHRHAYVYGLASVLVGYCLTIVIMGSVRWTIGFSPVVCRVETT